MAIVVFVISASCENAWQVAKTAGSCGNSPGHSLGGAFHQLPFNNKLSSLLLLPSLLLHHLFRSFSNFADLHFIRRNLAISFTFRICLNSALAIFEAESPPHQACFCAVRQPHRYLLTLSTCRPKRI